jgi:hypothetical protein
MSNTKEHNNGIITGFSAVRGWRRHINEAVISYLEPVDLK